MKRLLTLLLYTFLAISCGSDHIFGLEAPDRSFYIRTIIDETGSLYYTVIAKDEENSEIISLSPLGLETSIGSFSSGLSILSLEGPRAVVERYIPLDGEQKEKEKVFNELILHMKNAENKPFDLVIRTARDGIAFRYHFPFLQETDLKVLEEKTTFNIITSENAAFDGISPSDSLCLKTKNYWIRLSDAGKEVSWPLADLRARHSDSTYWITVSLAKVSTGDVNSPEFQAAHLTSPWRLIAISKESDPGKDSDLAAAFQNL